MLESLLGSIPNGNKKHPIAWYRMLQTVEDRIALARNKFLQAGLPRTAGVEILRWMLLNFNLDEAKSYGDDTSLYTEYLSTYQDNFRNVFDPVWTKSLGCGKFVHGKGSVHPAEIYLNCSVSNPADLPLGEDWTEWKNYSAVNILYHNSTELPMNMFTGHVSFEQRPPTFVVIAINVPLLLMKWYKYNQVETNPDETEFIKTEEFDNLLYDMEEIWITNVLLLSLMRKNATVGQICSELSVPGFVTSDGIIKNGIAGLKENLNLLDARALKLQDFLDTQWLYMHTIRQKVNLLEEDFVLPDTRQYLWLNILKTLPYLKMITSIIDHDPENPLFNPLIRKAYNLYVKSIKFANLPNYQYSTAVKTFVSLSCKEFMQIFKDKISAPTEVPAAT